MTNKETELVECVDAEKWAIAFVEALEFNPQIATNKEIMQAWFANALMAGHDAAIKKVRDEQRSNPE